MSRFGLRSSSDIFKLSEEHSNRKKMDKDSKMTLKRNCQKKRVVGLKKEVELNELCYKREENRPSVSIVCSLPLNRLTGFIEKLKTNNLSFGIQSQCGPKTSLNEEKIDEGINLGQKQSKGDACDNSGSNIQDFDDCNSILEESVRILCLYCDKKFTSNKMQLKHVEKFHIHQKNRRCSGRNSQMSTIIDGKKQREEPCSVILAKYPGCTYCKRSKTHQIEASAKDLNGLFVHFIDCHSDRYFGCQTCMQRFQNLGKLTQHMQTIHKDLSLLPDEGLKNKNIDLCISEKSDGEKISREKVKSTKTRYSKPQKNVTITSSSPEDSSPTKSNTIMGAEEPILSRLGLAQNRLPNNRKGVRSRKDSLLSESILKPDQPSVYTSAVKARNKSGKNAIRESGDAEVIFRMPTRTEMLSSSFDENFYREVISNVRNNLLYFLDGKLFDKVKSVISSNSTITAIKHQIPTIRSNLAESSVVLHESNSLETEIHAATSLATITAFPTLLTAEQYGGDAVISKIRRPHTKNSWKWKWDSVKKYKLINEGGKIVKKMKQPMLGLRDLSKLDMWTQLSMRQKHEMQQYIQNLDAKSHGNESFREERQRINEQLNYILDMRLLPHIILEQSEQAVIKIESDEFDVGLSYIRNSDDDRVANILNQSFIDNTFFSVLQLLPNQELQYHRKQLVLSGEWARPRCYLCMCCGAKFEKLKSLEEHKMFRHSHILSTHYEVVGRELLAGDSIRHLFIPNRALSYYGNDNYNTSNLLLRKFGWKKPDLQDTSRRIVGSIGDDDSSDSIPSTLNSSTINTYSVKHSTADECDTDTKTTLDINTGSPSNSMQSSNSLFATPLQLQTKCKDKGSISIKCSKCTRKCSGTLDLYRHMLDCSGDYIWSLAKKRKYRYYCGSKKRRSWNKHNYTELRKKQPKSSKPSTPPNDTEESVSSSKIKNPSRQRPSDGISYLNAVGRRPKIRKDAFLDIVERNKEKVITSNKSIVPRTNPIWEIIAKDLDVGVKASTVYAKVGSNTFGALDLLRGVTREYLGNSSSSGMQSNTASNDSSQEPMDVKFEILMRREEFFKLTKHKTYKSTRICKTERSYRRWLVFKPGEWQSIFADKIWENTRFKCAIHFRKHYLALRGDSGSIYGYCRCGSRFHATFENDFECDIIWFCTLRPGPTGKKCGKVYVRKSLRKKIANQLQNEHVDVFRSKKANELMRDGDPEPSILPYGQTLYSLKSLEKQKKYLHTDPILAIDVMKSSQYANVIQCLWYRPFCVHYWTNQQIHIVKKCFSSENFKISINATGGVCHRLHDKHIFLYQIAVNCGQQFTVAQMLSNSHRTDDIQYWLQMWQSAAPFAPKEILMDCAKALLHASARVFAGFLNIYEYSNAVASQETMPRCYIRLDVAHFIHTYARYLKGTMSLVRTFWLAIIGHLIMCKSKQQAQQVLKSIFIVAKSPTEGLKTNKDPTSCEAHKKQLETLVTAESIKKMLENLPPKRICKKIFPTLTKTKKSKFIAKHKMFSSQGRIRSTRTRQISKLSKAKTKFSNKTTKNKKGLHRKTDNILVKRKPKLISNTGLSLESNATLTTLSKHSEKKDIESLQNSSDKQSVYLDNNATVNAGKNLEDKYKAAMTPSKGHTLTEDKARTTKIAPELGILTTGSRVCDSLRSNKSDQLEHSQKNTVLEVLGNNEAQNNVQCIDNTTCNKKRSKKINDCIAMLTGKLEEKLKTEQHSLSRDGSCLETDVSKNKLANETKVPKRKAVSRKIIKIDNVTSQTTLAETRTVLDSTPISPVVMATMPCTPLIANTITPQIIPLSTTSMAITPPKATVQNNVNMNYIPNAMKINLLQGSDKFSQFKRHKTQFVTPNMDSAISVLPQIPLAPPNANTAILLPKQPTTKVADKINKLPPALPLPNPMKELVPPFPPLPLPLPLQNIQVNVSPIQPPLPPPPPPVLSVLSQSALLPAPVPLTPVVPVAPMAPIVPVAPTTPIVHVAPLFNSEPLNLSNSKNMKKHNPNELVCLPPYRSGIPARRQTICGFEAKNFILEDEPLDLSKKSNKDQASDAPAVVTLMPIIIKPIEPQNAHPVGINLPVSPYQDAVLNKQFYSNLELLKIPQVRNAGNTTTTSSETVFASSSPKCSSKKRNAGKNNNEITLKQIVTNNGKNANKETSSNKKDNAAKGKISQKMDDEVINHIDDAINSVINASLPDNDDEDSKQNKFNLNSNIVPQINPTPPSVNLIRIAPVEQITQMQTQSTSSDQHIISNLPLTFFNSQKNNEEITKNEDEIINTVKPLVFLPQKRYVRSKTLDCRPSILAVTPETVSDSMQHLPDEPVPVNNFTNGNVATTKSLTISANSVSSAIIENFTEALIDSPNKAVCKLKSGSCENPIEDCELAHCQKTNKDISVSNEISINAKKVLSPPRNSHNEVNNCVSPQVYASNEINPSIITEENMSNINNTSSGFHSSGQVDNTVEAKKKQRRRRKNELAAIVADQLLESFKIDKTRRDNLKKLENLAYEKSEDLFVTGMLLMSSTKRNVTSSKSDQSNNDGNLNKNSQDATRQKQDQSKTKSNKVRQKLNIALEPLNINNEPSEKPKVEEIVNKRSRKKQYRGKSKPLDNENISKLKSSLESFSIGIEKQLTELEQRNSVAITVSETKVLNTSPVSVRPSLLRPSILSANMESNVTDSRTPITESKSTISSRDPRLNKNIHKNEQNKPFEARACENEKPLNEIGDVEEDNYLTEIAKNVNEKIMSAENEEFMFVNDDFELANELQDDSNSKFYSRPPTSMSVRSAPNFNDDRSNFGSICDENTNTEVMDMDLEDELSVYTSYSQDVGRGRGRRRRRRRSILLKRRPKKRVNPDSPTEKFECTLCKKVFYSLNSLTKHNMTLAHVSKLSAQEYLLSKTLENSSTITPVDSTVKELQIYNPIEGTSTKIPTDGNNMQRITEVKDTEFNQTHFSNPEQIQNSISRREQGHTTKDKTTFNNSSRLNLNPDERLFFECCNILKGAETACITNADENIAGSSFEYNFKDKTSICVVQDSNLKSLRDETPKKRLTPDRVICKPTNSHHEFRSPALQSTVVNKHGPSITSRDQNSPNYSGVSQFSAVTNTTSRFKTKAAMKGYENTNVDLILCKELEAKTPVVCKLTELAEIALGNEKSNSPDFTNLSNQQEGSIFRQLTNREYLTSSVAVDNPKNCSDGNADRTKSNEAHSSTSSKTIMHNSKIKPSIGENSKTVCRKIVIPDRPFKNIGLEEKETITFQKPKTSVNLLTDDNSVSTTTYSDRDDFDFASLSCDEEPDPKIGNERNIKNTSDSSSSRATAKTFENKSLIMDRIFKNMGTKAKTTVKVQSIGIQKDPSPKADINQLFDELRGDCGTKVRPTENITKKTTNLESFDNMQSKQRQAPYQEKVIPPSRRPKETRKKSNVSAKSQKEITRLQSELGMSQEEIVKLINEGQRKSKRRCATNRPKKLVEMWSSDEYEEFLSTKDIIALIEEKEKQETRKKRKTASQISTSSNKNKDTETPKLITNRRKSVRCITDKEDNKSGNSPEIQKNECSKTNGTAKTQSNNVPTHSLESKGKHTRRTTSADNDIKHRNSISSELNHKSTINNKKRKVSKDNSDAVATKTLALNRDTKKASKIQNSQDCTVKDVPYKDDNPDNYISDKKQSNSRTRSNKDKKYSESKDTVNSIKTLNKKSSTSVVNKKHNNANNQSYKNRRKNQSSQSPPRRKRLASEKLYYWSSSSDEDFGKINSSCAQEFDNGEQYQKHGWIVGDSHKKLVTLLAIAKGNKKVDNSCSVKKNVGRKKNVC